MRARTLNKKVYKTMNQKQKKNIKPETIKLKGYKTMNYEQERKYNHES